jgi:phosphoribosyl 1,2-cyclic phosphate phosphodiesterase
MLVKVLGSGTSQGVPIIGCGCDVCTSTDYRDHRLRSSIHIETEHTHIQVDIGPDFRQQMLRSKITHIDAIVLTHEHNDHIAGLDDVRPFNFRQKKAMQIYGLARVIADVRSRFAYVFDDNPYPGAPLIETHIIERRQQLHIGDLTVQCIPIMHGKMEIIGFRINNFAYICDVSEIADSEISELRGVDTLIISALHHRPHPAHLTLAQAIAYIDRVAPRAAYITHISHEMGRYDDICERLPDHIRPAIDGMEIVIHTA